MVYSIDIDLLSDATFGRGEGVAGYIDSEVEHDSAVGLPFMRGRTLRGLLVEECANILYAVERSAPAALDRLEDAAAWLFGGPGSSHEDSGCLDVGPAQFPETLRSAVRYGIENQHFTADEVLGSLTAIRRQTAIDKGTGVPLKNSLRSQRVLVRTTRLSAVLEFTEPPTPLEITLLAACVQALRRAGAGRNRGRGRIRARLYKDGVEVRATDLLQPDQDETQ